MRLTLAFALCLLCAPHAVADDWPHWLGPKGDGVWHETGIRTTFPAAGPKLLWRTPIGQGYSGPAVVGDRVYVMDRLRARDADGKPLPRTPQGFPGKDRLLCLDANSGKEIWKYEYDRPYALSYGSGPRVTPLVRDGRVYAVGGMGDLFCLETKKGEVVWKKDLLAEYKLDRPQAWGFAAHPVIHGKLLYILVGGKDSAIVAFDKDSGKEVWKGLNSAEVGYSPPVLVHAGSKDQLIVWLSESVNSVDPLTGKLHWTQEYPVGRPPQRPAVNIATVVPSGDQLFLSTVYHGSMMLQLDKEKPAAEVLWRGKGDPKGKPDGLHILMATPMIKDKHVYGVCAMGEVRCLDAQTGKQKWQTYDLTGGEKSDCGTVFLVPLANSDRVVAFNDNGELLMTELTPKGHKVHAKARIIEPVEKARGREVVWSHPAFAQRSVFVRNDKEILRVSLAEDSK